MITQRFAVTLISFVNFDGISEIWKDFPYLGLRRDKESNGFRPARLRGSVWYYGAHGLYHGVESGPNFPGSLQEMVTVTSDFVLTHEAVIEYNGKEYHGMNNFGRNRSVLAFNISAVKGKIFENTIKLYTTMPTNEFFRDKRAPLLG